MITSFSAKEIYEMPFEDLCKNVDSGKISWGDIGWAEDVMNPKPITEIPQLDDPFYTMEEEMLENWSVPDLTLRKGIWENFPVSLVPINDGDGTDRYAVVWHRKNLEEWNKTRPESYDEYQDYESWCEWRLRYALNAYSRKYTVEEPRDDDMILVIAMVHLPKDESCACAEKTKTPASAVPATATPDAPAAIEVPSKFRDLPKLTRLNDIKNNFPVVWHETPSKTGSKVYAVELFGKKIKELSATAGYDVTEEISSRLMASLKASPSWKVLSAESPREFCRIKLA
jgi:hypothetical protein